MASDTALSWTLCTAVDSATWDKIEKLRNDQPRSVFVRSLILKSLE